MAAQLFALPAVELLGRFPCLVWGEPISSKSNPTFSPQARVFSAMYTILNIVLWLLNLFTILVFASVIMSLLVAFNIVNTRNQLVSAVWEFLYRITEPLLAPIRRVLPNIVLPNLGAIDISPMVLLLIIWIIEKVIVGIYGL